jgi:hypothetical protein
MWIMGLSEATLVHAHGLPPNRCGCPQQVRTGARLHELLPSTEQMLRARAVVLPGVTVLERLVGTARVAAEEELF